MPGCAAMEGKGEERGGGGSIVVVVVVKNGNKLAWKFVLSVVAEGRTCVVVFTLWLLLHSRHPAPTALPLRPY